MPQVNRYDPAVFESDLDQPTGLVVSQVLAELRPDRRVPRQGARATSRTAAIASSPRSTPGCRRCWSRPSTRPSPASLMKGQPRQPAGGGGRGGAGHRPGARPTSAGTTAPAPTTPARTTRADGAVAGFGAHPPGRRSTSTRWPPPSSRGISVQSRGTRRSARRSRPAAGRRAPGARRRRRPVPAGLHAGRGGHGGADHPATSR